jgi:probable F420-dependent oxidoreductase
MQFGVMSPIVSRNPRHDPPAWEAAAGIEELSTVALRAEALGFDFMTFPEHVAVPVEAAPVRGATYWAPLPTMGYLAAKTSRLRLATYVLVLGYHHPLELAKSYGTLHRICDGRLVLGVGVGSLEPEFALLGADFPGRGPRADDALRALRASFGVAQPEYEGSHFRFEGLLVDPWASARDVPIWVGGRTGRSLRRAVTLGDGWAPFGLAPDVVRGLLDGGPAPPPEFEVVLAPEPPIDPAGAPDATRAAVERYRAAGATHLVFRFRQHSLHQLLEQMEALMELFPEARV